MKAVRIIFRQPLGHIKNFLTKGHPRSVEAKKNIVASFFIKGFSILINLVLVPVTINYINPTQYGIWLTLSSIITWFSFFDIGFGNGLRNRFAESKALGDYQKARIYLSTTYAILTIIFFILWMVYFIINHLLDWTLILNAPKKMFDELSLTALIVFSFFCIQMVLRLITTIFIADQKPAKASLIGVSSQLVALIVIWVLTKTAKSSLVYLGLSFGAAQLVVFLLASFWFYTHDYKFYSPRKRYIDWKYARDIFTLGSKFFLIQVSFIIIYQTNNLIITQISNPIEVTYFNIAYKYLSIALMLFTIILNPYWSAYTDAYARRDYIWMKNTYKKLQKILYLYIFSVIILIIISNFVYKIWVGSLLIISSQMTISVGIYIILIGMVSLYTQILNGLGKIKVQLFAYSFAIFFHIPFAILLGKIWGSIGVVISASIFYVIVWLTTGKQLKLLIDNKSYGIWNS